MKSIKLAAIPVIAIAAGISIAACSGQPAYSHAAATKTTRSAKPEQTTPAPAAPAAQSAPAAALPTVSGVGTPDDPRVRPSGILLFADGSFALTGITWSSWTADRAEGSGALYSSNGSPSQATGAKTSIPVSIALSAPTSGGKPYFTAMTVTDSAGHTDTFTTSYLNEMTETSSGITSAGTAPSAPASSSAPSGYTGCGTGTGASEVYAGPNTSCAFAISVEETYHATGTAMPTSGSRSISVYSSVTGQSYTMECSGSSLVTCTGGNDASVEFDF